MQAAQPSHPLAVKLLDRTVQVCEAALYCGISLEISLLSPLLVVC